MTLSLDHVFVIVESSDVGAEGLLDLGLVEGDSNKHPGQGTANRRFFLNDFMLELLFVSDVEEATNGAGRQLGILDRSIATDASPFGLIARMPDGSAEPEFPHWDYYPDYFGGQMCFHIGDNSSLLEEPLCICMPPSLPKPSAVPVAQANPGWRLSSLEISFPSVRVSPVLKSFGAIDRLALSSDKPHHLFMTFNEAAAGKTRDLRPELPVTILW